MDPASSRPGHTFTNVKLSGAAQAHLGDNYTNTQDFEVHFFKTLNYESYKNVNPIRVPDTCAWFLEHPTYIKWRDSDQDDLLWLSADPGCGKSVLSRALIDERLSGLAPTHYFFFKDNEEQNSASKALCALLHQLFRSKTTLFSKYAVPAIKVNGERLKIEFEELWRLLMAAATDPEIGEVICVLDALDECNQDDRDKLIEKLEEFYTASSRHSRTRSSLKFLVTSRPYQQIELRFFNLTKRIPTVRLAGEDESEAISREINVVVKAKIQQIGEQLGLSDPILSILETKLSEIPQRTYLWLRLIWDEFRNTLGKTKIKLLKVIEELPETVEEAYEKLLANCGQKEEARKVLHIIVAAQRPLTLSEIDVALEIRPHSRSYKELDLEGEENRKHIRNLCGLFVTIVDSKVYLIHQTAKEFLVQRSCGGLNLDKWRSSLAPEESHKILAEICITLLFFDEFQEDQSRVFVDGNRLYERRSLQEVREQDRRQRAALLDYAAKNALLDYSANHWITHLRATQTGQGNNLINLASKLCEIDVGRYPTCWEICWASNPASDYAEERDFIKLPPRSEKNLKKPLALYWAAMNGLNEVVHMLLKRSASSNAVGGRCGSALQAAAAGGHEKVVEQLLESSADVNAQGGHYGSALHAAAAGGHEKIVEQLLQAHADVSAQGGSYGTALQAAAAGGHEKIVEQLLHGQADVNARGGSYGTALQAAALRGHEKVVKLLLQAQADVDARGGSDGTALQEAAARGHEKVVKLLLQAQADVDARGGSDGTALQEAAARGHEKVMKLLLQAKADVDAQGGSYGSALQAAAARGHERIVEQLLQANAHMNARDEFYSFTLAKTAAGGALQIAHDDRHEKLVLLLLEHRTTFHAQDDRWTAVFQNAVDWGNPRVIQHFIDKWVLENAAEDETLLQLMRALYIPFVYERLSSTLSRFKLCGKWYYVSRR